jgi:hypothetical protein
MGSLPFGQQKKILALIQDVDGAEHVMQCQKKTASHIMTTHFFLCPKIQLPPPQLRKFVN